MEADFTDDCRYFAALGEDGRLRVWDAVAGRLEQEHAPDYHLAAPCTCLRFRPAPKKRRKAGGPEIVLGTAAGLLLVYSVAEGAVVARARGAGGCAATCVALGLTRAEAYSGGADGEVTQWDLRNMAAVGSWKVGGDAVTAVLVVQGWGLLTAGRGLKLWDARSRKLLRSFPGHGAPVGWLRHAAGPYVVSGARGDRLLHCWNLEEQVEGGASTRRPAVSFLAEDGVRALALHRGPDSGRLTLAAAVQGGAVHLYRHTLNGRCDRPIKPSSTVRVVQEKEVSEQGAKGKGGKQVVPLQVLGTTLIDDDRILVAHGNQMVLTFENVSVDFTEAVQCLVRGAPEAVAKAEKEADATKLKKPIIGNHVHYSTRDVSTLTPLRPGIKRGHHPHQPRVDAPLEQRLRALDMDTESSARKRPDSVARLLTQALHSGDAELLRVALAPLPEAAVGESIRRLPVEALAPLARHLGGLLRGKTGTASVAAVWTKCLMRERFAELAAHPDLIRMMRPIRGALEARTARGAQLRGLRDRLEAALEAGGRLQHREDKIGSKGKDD